MTVVLLGLPFQSFAGIFKCPMPSGVFEYTSISCANGFRKEGDQWIDIAAERKQRIAAAEERKMRSENESKLQITSAETSAVLPNPSKPESSAPGNKPSPFKCDGRTHCSQMTSCDEAKFFLKNCPNVKMDGNNDGVPCEQQWCK